MEDKRIIGITIGDSASVGSKITAKVLADQSVHGACRPIVVGDACALEVMLKIVGREEMTIRIVENVRDAVSTHGTIDTLDMGLVSMDGLVRGQVFAMCGDATLHYVKRAIGLVMDGQVDVTITNAFNKGAVDLTGHHYSGHTEIYADLTGTKDCTAMLAHKNVRVIHVPTHVSLREACSRVKKQRVLDAARVGDRACREMRIEDPRITVVGLNPHSGKYGLFGQGEIQEIIPAIEAARAKGIQTEDPVSSDTAFSKARGDWYDIVVVMHHGQGHTLLKVVGSVYNRERQTRGMVADVNITLGLPVIRVSMDRGAALDQVGTRIASELSSGNSLEYVVMSARNQKQYNT